MTFTHYERIWSMTSRPKEESTMNQLTFYSDTAEGRERALYAFLAEKE